jgi:pimeloyl-ACP methyl ester carboxylesterase
MKNGDRAVAPGGAWRRRRPQRLAWRRSVARERFTVYAMDRRGRGASGDAPEYALEREFEDVAAAVDALPGPVYLYGHSFGGVCAVEAGTAAAT